MDAQHYANIASKLSQVTDVQVTETAKRMALLDEKRMRERLTKSLEDMQRFLSENPGKTDAFKGARESVAGAEKLLESGNLQSLMEKLSEARKRLLEEKVEGVPGVPSAPPPRLDIKTNDAVAALKRRDIAKIALREDSWGSFDLDRALSKEATEEDLSVLWKLMQSAMEANLQDKDWLIYEKDALTKIRENGGKPTRIFKELILGTGASAAYCIANNLEKFDIDNTLVIGKIQPWDGERGRDGNVNHPHNMIDPEYDDFPIDAEGSLAERAEFSERIAKVIAKLPKINASIGKVIRRKGDYFEIQTDLGEFYCRKVTNALGIGPQKEPGPIDPAAKANGTVRDMDSFKRALDGIKPIREVFKKPDGKPIESIAVIGSNAAIDVVTAIVRDQAQLKGSDSRLKVHWILGSSPPAFLKGTDNELAEQAFPKGTLAHGAPLVSESQTLLAYKAYYKESKGSGPVTVTYTETDKDKSNPKTLVVDMVVYGSGPNAAAMKQMFVDDTGAASTSLELAPVLDKDQHYNFHIDETDPEKLLAKLGKVDSEVKRTALGKLLGDPSLKGVPANDTGVIIGVQSKDSPKSQSTLNLVGASGVRLDVGGKDSQGNDVQMLGARTHEAPATLGVNVVGNDQLTASRSLIESELNALPISKNNIPLVTVPGGVNFITANQTVIAVHIAECYPNIPSGLAAYVTGQIIYARGHPEKFAPKLNPVPVPRENDTLMLNMSLEQQVAFQKEWMARLEKISGELLSA